MQHRHQVRYRVTARRNNVIVVVQETGTRAEADVLAARMESVDGTDAEIAEVIDPNETDLTTFSRELSESIGWRDTTLPR